MTENLRQWYLFYRKNRDLMLRKIENLEEKENIIIINNKDGTKEICIVEEISSSYSQILKKYNKTDRLFIITLNKKSNIELMIKEWDDIIEYSGLTMMFVNPNITNDNKWILKPAVHNKITEREVLKTGIYSLSENIELC
ncbi:MAG: hypothetical protein ACMXYG_07005 [Candidatus Woesearchaeota archaeon]